MLTRCYALRATIQGEQGHIEAGLADNKQVLEFLVEESVISLHGVEGISSVVRRNWPHKQLHFLHEKRLLTKPRAGSLFGIAHRVPDTHDLVALDDDKTPPVPFRKQLTHLALEGLPFLGKGLVVWNVRRSED